MDENIARTKSGKDLLNRLNVYDDSLICSLVHKFGRRGGEATENDYDKYIEELKASLPANFEAKGNLVVFVDECHRTQSGKLHTAMKTIMPNAVFIGFTGTPLLKRDKKISIEVFGTYIHAYKYNEGVADGVVLDLRYEYRDVPQDLSSQDRIDQWFDVKTRGLSSRAKAKLKEKWGTMQKVYSSRSRLEKVAWDIIQDFNMKPRLMDGNGNAILVADGIPTACKYYEIFQQMGFKKCAIISSYTPNKGELRTDTVSDEDDTETFLKYETYLKMLGLDPSDLPNAGSVQAKVEEFEKEAKRKFVEEPANMKLLIVVDKLLTGFDAPPCTYLYIDKRMQDHGLFQAICRVNRLDDDTKDFGYIVDYKQLFGQLQTAMKDYTSGAFEGYDPEDVKGLVKDRHDATVSYFEEVYDAVEELCEGVEEPHGEIQYIHYFCGVSGQSEESDEIYARLREKLYRLVSSLVRAFAEAKPYLIDDISSGKLNEYDKKVTFYIELKKTIGTASGDFLDLKAYEPDMRKMIDNYITAADAEKIGDFDDLTLLDFVAKQGETLTGEGDSGHKEGAAEAIGAVGFGEDGKLHPTTAGLLMFGEEYHIVREFPEYFLDYREMLDPTIRWTDRLQSSSGDWSGNVFDFFFRVNSKIAKDIKKPFKLEGITRVDDTPVHKAVREALVNCLVNTDYFLPCGVVIKKEDDKLVIENPGSIRTGKKQMLRGGISDPRNKTLMKMFNMIGIGERAGSGIPDIYQVWENEGWPMPVVEESYNPDRTRLSLEFAKKQTIKTSEEEKEPKRSQKGAEKEPIKGAERKKEILKLIKVNSTITQVEIMKELDLTRKQVQRI